MKKLLILLIFFLASCSNKDYSLNAIIEPDEYHFFDSEGQRWIREDVDDFGKHIEGGKTIKNTIIPHCFLNQKKVFSFINPKPEIYGSDINIVWYARIEDHKNMGYFLFGESMGRSLIKINNSIHINEYDPKSEMKSIIDQCRKNQREKKRERILSDPLEKPVNI